MNLSQKKCKPCEGGVEPFDRERCAEYLSLVPGWRLSEDGVSILKQYKFKNFKEALAFVNSVGVVAEEEGHHPDISFTWGKVEIRLSTHSIGGISENDFILAFKIDHMK